MHIGSTYTALSVELLLCNSYNTGRRDVLTEPEGEVNNSMGWTKFTQSEVRMCYVTLVAMVFTC